MMSDPLDTRRRAPAARPRAAGARRRGPPVRRFRRRRGRRAGSADRGGHAVAARGHARQPARLADPGRRAAHDRPRAQRDRAPPARGMRALGRSRACASRSRRAAPPDADVAEHDDTLVLLFMCCHPALTPPSAIALTLRAVGGLPPRRSRSAFLVPEATMAQRISRAKQSIKTSGVPFELPTDQRARRAPRAPCCTCST